MSFEPVLTKNMHLDEPVPISRYMDGKGYEALKKALGMEATAVIDEVEKANLRGRGGAGFPAGRKWKFIPKDGKNPVYLACNADESEPGTFKDRAIIEHDPHMIIEGIAIASYAIDCHRAFIYIRGEYTYGAKCLDKALDQAYEAGVLGRNILGSGFNLELTIMRGAGAYICGDETALMESIEGKRGNPRMKPPFPAQIGLFGGPTVINNVETLSCVPHVITRGAEWFNSIGPESSPGPKLFSVSGHVKKPGVKELPMGVPLKELIYDHCGGILDDKPIKAVIPGGSSVPVLTADEIDINMDFDSVAKAGSMLGSGGTIVMNDSVCMVDALWNLLRFYAHESCGQCTPCREGCHWMEKIVGRIETGKGRPEDLDLILDIADNISFKTVCPLGDAACGPAISFVNKFREEFEEHIKLEKCPMGIH